MAGGQGVAGSNPASPTNPLFTCPHVIRAVCSKPRFGCSGQPAAVDAVPRGAPWRCLEAGAQFERWPGAKATGRWTHVDRTLSLRLARLATMSDAMAAQTTWL